MKSGLNNPGLTQRQIAVKQASSTSVSVTAVPTLNRCKAKTPAVTIGGGGSLGDEQLIGYHHRRQEFAGPGSVFVWPYEPVGAIPSLTIIKHTADRVRTSLGHGSGWTGVVSGGQTEITLTTPLLANESIAVEDKAAIVESPSNDLGYAWIGGGYDNVIYTGVMQQCTGAHHRILGGDHGTILGGSYSTIKQGSYVAIVGGTSNEIDGVGPGAVILGGMRNRVTGSGASIVGSASSRAIGAMSAIVGGEKNVASGTASVILGRNNNASGSDSYALGNGNICSGGFSQAFGQSHVVAQQFSGVLGGRGITTRWAGERVSWGHRDATVGTNVLRKVFAVDLTRFTNDIAFARLETMNGVTSLIPPNSVAWICRLSIVARSGALLGAAFDSKFAVQRNATTTSFLGGAPVVALIGADVSFGVDQNAPVASVEIAGDGGIEVIVRSRQDSVVPTKWFGWLEVVEVG